MKCNSCKTVVDSKFQHAIKSNQCPACGSAIMSPELLVSFASLKSLLAASFPGMDADSVASVVVANFDINQKFKDLSPAHETPVGGTTVEVVEDEDPDAESKKDN